MDRFGKLEKILTTCLLASSFAAAQVLVDGQKLQDSIVVQNLLAHTQALEDMAYATPGRNRYIASLGHNSTLQYIVDQLGALNGYYHVTTQPVHSVVAGESNASLVINGQTYSAKTVKYSAGVSLTDTAVVVVSNLGCSAEDYPQGVSGSIALMARGTCTFKEKAFLAKQAGAAAAIFYNDVLGNYTASFTQVNDTLAPAVLLPKADGLALVAAAGNGTALIAGTLDIAFTVVDAYSQNIIATTTYATDSTDILFLGAHSDSVVGGPGINDNASGCAGLLETAIQLARGGYTALPTIQFAWWTGEEETMLGSKAYIDSYASAEELARIRLYLNYDMIASPNYVLGVYDGDSSSFPAKDPGPAGSAEAEAALTAWFAAQGQNSTPAAFEGRSDYGPFLDAGIPVNGVYTGADAVKTEHEALLFGGTAGVAYDVHYHKAGDNMTNLARGAFEICSKSIAHAVGYYGANGFATFPARGAPAGKRESARYSTSSHGQGDASAVTELL